MEMSDRHDNMKYLLMARSAEEGKNYLEKNKKELARYTIMCIGGYLMANEEAEPEKIAFILAIKINCLPCPIFEKCLSKTISEGLMEIEKVENVILALEINSKSIEYNG